MTESNTGPQIKQITRNNGIAGQYQLHAQVSYGGEPPEHHWFVGSVYGGPIVAVGPSGAQQFVSRAVIDRLGTKLDEEWVRGFYRQGQ